MFCGCGIGGNCAVVSADAELNMPAESLRPFSFCFSSAAAVLSCSEPNESESVGLRGSTFGVSDCFRWFWIWRAKASGSATAAVLRSCSVLRSRLLFSRCSCRSEIADRSAIASGFSLSDIGTDGGCFRNVAAGGGDTWLGFCGSVGATGASCATDSVGVIGDTGGRSGDCDRDRWMPRSLGDVAVVFVGETGVSLGGEGIVSAGMLRRGQRTS